MPSQQSVANFQGIAFPTLPATIASGQTESNAINLAGLCFCGIKIPAGFTGTAVTLEMCDTVGGVYVPLIGTSGSLVSITVSGASNGNFYAVDPVQTHGVQFLKIKSNATEAALRNLVVALKGI